MDIIKAQHGGARKGAGRPKGARSKKTILKELMQRNAVDDVLKRLTGEEVQKLTPLEVMQIGMTIYLQQNNLSAAIATADRLAPYIHPRMASAEIKFPLPEDMRPDPPATPDDGSMPDGGIIE